MLELTHHFENKRRDPRAPKAFVSEYAATYPFQIGTFEGALAEAAFLLSLEQNRYILVIKTSLILLLNYTDYQCLFTILIIAVMWLRWSAMLLF